MDTKHVEKFCRETWEARERGELRGDEFDLIRGMHAAIGLDLRENPELRYDPDMDRRVLWLREVIAAKREHPGKVPRASGPLEDVMRWMMTGVLAAPCGKDLAAEGGNIEH